MIGIFNITDNKLESWVFGLELTELKDKVIKKLNAEENPLKREELEELISQLAALNHIPIERIKLTQHFYFVNLQSSIHQQAI